MNPMQKVELKEGGRIVFHIRLHHQIFLNLFVQVFIVYIYENNNV